MKELLEYLARGLVADPEAVRVTEVQEDDGSLVLELSVGAGRLRQRDRPRRPHRGRAAHGDQGGGGPRQAPRVRRHRRRLTEPERWLLAGTVGRPHGLDGSFHVAGAVAELLVAGAQRSGRTDTSAESSAGPGFDARPIVRLDGCCDRDAAEALRGAELLVAREPRTRARRGRVVGARPRGLRGARRSRGGGRRHAPARAALLRGARGGAQRREACRCWCR